MKKLTGKELEEGMKHIKIAAEASKKSGCLKSTRGAVLVKNGKVIATGYNSPPCDQKCPGCIREHIHDNSRVELCRSIHAEQKAILNALKDGHNLTGSRLYHIKVKNSEIRTSDDISCTICSRMILESGVSEMALLHSTGLTVYDTKEFNDLSFKYFEK